MTMVVDIWKPRLQKLCHFWSLRCLEKCWREQYLRLHRPRWDGVYVGQCQYLHKVRPGSSLTYKGSCVWVSYRRYIRLFPPNEDGELRALVLQDAAPMDMALSLLMSSDIACPSVFGRGKESKSHLERKIAVASYDFHLGHVRLKYNNDNGQCNLTLKVAHSKKGYFSEQLNWVDYTLSRPGEDVTCFDLGRNEWGDPRNPSCDHFPPFVLHRQPALEHHLQGSHGIWLPDNFPMFTKSSFTKLH